LLKRLLTKEDRFLAPSGAIARGWLRVAAP